MARVCGVPRVSKDEIFQQPDDVARDLAREIREMKEILRDMARKLSQLEMRARRGFPAAFPVAPKKKTQTTAATPAGEPTIVPSEALRIYDELVALARSGSREQVQSRLNSFGVPDLFLLSRELGVSLGRKRPSRPSLVAGILGRINESVMLSTSTLRD